MHKRTLPANHPSIANATHNLSYTLWKLGRRDEALELQEQALQMFKRAGLPETHPRILLALETWIKFLDELLEEKKDPRLLSPDERRRRLVQLLKVREELLQFRTRMAPVDHADVSREMLHVASVLHKLDRVEDALKVSQEMREYCKRWLPRDRLSNFFARQHLAIVLRALGRSDECAAVLAEKDGEESDDDDDADDDPLEWACEAW